MVRVHRGHRPEYYGEVGWVPSHPRTEGGCEPVIDNAFVEVICSHWPGPDQTACSPAGSATTSSDPRPAMTTEVRSNRVPSAVWSRFAPIDALTRIQNGSSKIVQVATLPSLRPVAESRSTALNQQLEQLHFATGFVSAKDHSLNETTQESRTPVASAFELRGP